MDPTISLYKKTSTPDSKGPKAIKVLEMKIDDTSQGTWSKGFLAWPTKLRHQEEK